MIKVLTQACETAKVRIDQLDLLVPHQANQRILDMIAQKLRLAKDRVFTNIKNLGNTSSSTIPLCLETLFEQKNNNKLFGLVAFGGGFTYGGTVLRLREPGGGTMAKIRDAAKQMQPKKFVQGALKRTIKKIKQE